MSEHRYFTVSTASRPGISDGRAIAILAGDAPVLKDDGSTSCSLRCPLLVLTAAFEAPQEVAEAIAEVLNENAHRFFPSAKSTRTRGFERGEVAS